MIVCKGFAYSTWEGLCLFSVGWFAGLRFFEETSDFLFRYKVRREDHLSFLCHLKSFLFALVVLAVLFWTFHVSCRLPFPKVKLHSSSNCRRHSCEMILDNTCKSFLWLPLLQMNAAACDKSSWCCKGTCWSNFQPYNGLWIGTSPVSMLCSEVSSACFYKLYRRWWVTIRVECVSFYIFGHWWSCSHTYLFAELSPARSSPESVAHSLCADGTTHFEVRL